MRCKGTTKKGTQCRRPGVGDSEFCSQHNDHLIPEPKEVEEIEHSSCNRCGPEKQAVHSMRVSSLPGTKVLLCESCAFALHSQLLHFLGVEDIDAKMLKFREKKLA
jgi:hypothetical protein